MGFCGLYMDPEVGGSGLSRLDAAVVIEELASVDPSTAAYISIHKHGLVDGVHVGPAGTARCLGHRPVIGNKLASYCLTEPGAVPMRPR